MKFVAKKTLSRFSIHLADEHAAKPDEKPGTRAGEPVVDVICVDDDGDRKNAEFYSSDALDQADVELLRAILDKLGAHAVKTFE